MWAQRREIMARKKALEQAKEGIFDLLGVQQDSKEWEHHCHPVCLIMDSQILSGEQGEQIHVWLAENKEYKNKHIKVELLYCASRDGWRAHDFHSRCDNKGATITVIKRTGGYVFGGYADASWNSNGANISSPSAFLFSLHNPGGVGVVKMPVTVQYASHDLYGAAQFGPAFGGSQLQVADTANINACQRNTQYFQLPPNLSTSFLTGDRTFLASEVEVFNLMF